MQRAPLAVQRARLTRRGAQLRSDVVLVLGAETSKAWESTARVEVGMIGISSADGVSLGA